MSTTDTTPLTVDPERPRRPGRVRLLVLAAVVLALVVGGGITLLLTGDDGDGAAPPATTVAPDGTTTPPTAPDGTGPATTVAPGTDTSTAVWPFAGSSTRYGDPVAAARGFAVDYVGIANPQVGTFQAGDSRSGEVRVGRMNVFVRQLGPDGSWWILGSSADRIQLTSPTASDVVSSPVRLQGRSSAFEGTVSVEILEDGNRSPLGSGFVTGGAGPELEPFDGTVEFAQPSAAAGAVLLFERSARDNTIDSASVVRVRFAGTGTTQPQAACQPATRPAPGSGQMVVTVFFTCGEKTLVPSYRVVPETSGVLRASLEQLLAGPTPAERNAGLDSWFSSETAGMLADVSLSNGRAVVDFRDLRPLIPNASTSAGSALLLRQLDATVFQFSTVRSVEYRIDGSCSTFFEWLQTACDVRTP